MKIGIFDSGIGGATVLVEILRVMPGAEYVYYSDSAHNPYGEKSVEKIHELSAKACDYLIGRGCKAVVIACNTASANAADYLRKKYPEVPIVAIEPAYKMVHDYAFDEPTLIMATRGTLTSEKFSRLYHKYDNEQTVMVDCSGLAQLIEKEDPRVTDFLKVRIGSLRGKIKNVVLGCTHYPLVKHEIAMVLNDEEDAEDEKADSGGGKLRIFGRGKEKEVGTEKGVKFFDGAEAVAKHLKEVLQEKKLLDDDWGGYEITGEDLNIEFYDTSGQLEKGVRFWKVIGRE